VAEGAISDRHAALICRTITDLPAAVLEQAGAVEATLVEHARTQNPDQLAVLTRPVRASPSVTLWSLSARVCPLSSQNSLMRDTRNTS